MTHDPALHAEASKDQSSLESSSVQLRSVQPWLTIVGIGADGLAGLGQSSRHALDEAEIVIGPERHVELIENIDAQIIVWPVPFADGVEQLLTLRGKRVVMLASGDPFWFGAGTVMTRHLDRNEWRAIPSPSTFSLAAAHLGWALDTTVCLGLHAAPFSRLRPHLALGGRVVVLMRDGTAIGDLADWLADEGFGESTLHVMEALGGPRERVRETTAEGVDLSDVQHPVAVGAEFAGAGAAIPQVSGLPDDLFEHDGQLTKRPVRAITLSTLAPRAGEHLWDIGAGSGSISIEWLLSHPRCQATAVEADAVRAGRARTNAARLGVDRLRVVEARALDTLDDLAPPEAVFIGGGLEHKLLEMIWDRVPADCRIVANAVTLESESLLVSWHDRVGGSLMQLSVADVINIGSKRGWRGAYPVVQWSVTR